MTSLALRRLQAVTRSVPFRSYATENNGKSLLLYTAGTPNGRKASILLEELKLAHGVDYEYVQIAHAK